MRAFVFFKSIISAFIWAILKSSLPPSYQRATALNADRHRLIKMQVEVFNPCKFWLIIYLYVHWHFYLNIKSFVYHHHFKRGHNSTMGLVSFAIFLLSRGKKSGLKSCFRQDLPIDPWPCFPPFPNGDTYDWIILPRILLPTELKVTVLESFICRTI